MPPSDPFFTHKQADRTVIRPSPGRRRPQPPPRSNRLAPTGKPTDANIDQFTVADDNPLLTSAFWLLSLVPKLRNLPFHDSVSTLQEQMIAEIEQFENRALQRGVNRDQVDAAKFLLCPLLDETVLNTPWGGNSGWGHHSLSSRFLRAIDLGQEFFRIVDHLKEDPSRNQNLLELAYICLSLGFEGKYRYRNNGLQTLERERRNLFLLLEKLHGDDRPELSIHWQAMQPQTNPVIRYVPLWVVAAATGALLLMIYTVFAVSIRDRSDRVYDALAETAKSIAAKGPAELIPPVATQPLPQTVSLQNRLETLLAGEIGRWEVALADGGIIRLFDLFPSGGADIRSERFPLIAKIARALREANAAVRVVGHTDNQRIKFSARFGSNWHLSQARAESVAAALSQNGVFKENMRWEGMADKAPLHPNSTPANRALNRRIDIYFR